MFLVVIPEFLFCKGKWLISNFILFYVICFLQLIEIKAYIGRGITQNVYKCAKKSLAKKGHIKKCPKEWGTRSVEV